MHPEGDPSLIPVGDTEFARDPAFGYRSSNLVHWIKEKCAGVDDGHASIVTEKVTSISLHDLREGGPAAVRARLANARGGCVVVNAVERRDLEVRNAEEWARAINESCALRVGMVVLVQPSLIIFFLV